MAGAKDNMAGKNNGLAGAKDIAGIKTAWPARKIWREKENGGKESWRKWREDKLAILHLFKCTASRKQHHAKTLPTTTTDHHEP
jgi:hypothetical protein